MRLLDKWRHRMHKGPVHETVEINGKRYTVQAAINMEHLAEHVEHRINESPDNFISYSVLPNISVTITRQS